MSFLSRYLDHTKNYESPTSFWKWSGYATIGTVLRDNIFRRQGETHLYPNMYILLLADSSVHRKGRPVDTCEMLVAHANNTKLISGSTSIQALIDELSRVETDAKTGKVQKSGSGLFLAQELSAALVEDPRAIKILTDIYDYKPMGYSVRLVSRSNSKIDRLVLSLFAASNEALLKDIYNSTAIYGGLLARTFLVLPDEFRPSNSLWEVPDTKSFDVVKDLLREISQLKGEVEFDQEAKQEYDTWYRPFRESYKNKNEKSGVVGRIHTSVMKLAMCLAANELTLNVKKHHVEEAIDEGTKLLPNYRTFLMSTGGSRNKEEIGAFVLETLLKSKDNKIGRKTLLQQPHFIVPDGVEMLDKMICTLEQGGIVVRIPIQNGTGILSEEYQLTEKGKEILKGD